MEQEYLTPGEVANGYESRTQLSGTGSNRVYLRSKQSQRASVIATASKELPLKVLE